MKTWVLRFRAVDDVNFELLRSGEKAIETRAATPKYQKIEVGDKLEFVCGEKRMVKTITKKYWWPNIDAMVAEIPFKKIMPRVASLDEMRRRYASYPSHEEKIEKFGLLGFALK